MVGSGYTLNNARKKAPYHGSMGFSRLTFDPSGFNGSCGLCWKFSQAACCMWKEGTEKFSPASGSLPVVSHCQAAHTAPT